MGKRSAALTVVVLVSMLSFVAAGSATGTGEAGQEAIGGYCGGQGFAVRTAVGVGDTVSVDLDGDGGYQTGETDLGSGEFFSTAGAGASLAWHLDRDDGSEDAGSLVVPDCGRKEAYVDLETTCSDHYEFVVLWWTEHAEVGFSVDGEPVSIDEGMPVELPVGTPVDWEATPDEGAFFPSDVVTSGRFAVEDCGAPAPGRLTVVKQTVGGDATFGFSVDADDDYTIGSTAEAVPGEYRTFALTTEEGTASETFDAAFDHPEDEVWFVVTELEPEPGWELTSVSCDADPAVWTVDEPGVLDVDLAPGMDVTCVFTNTRTTGTIVVRKLTQVGVGTFAFDLTRHDGELAEATRFDLTTTEPGVAAETEFEVPADSWYSLAEVAPLPAGWEGGLTCVNADGGIFQDVPLVSPDEFVVAPGGTVECTATNVYTPSQPEPTAVTVDVSGSCVTDESTFVGTASLVVVMDPTGGATVQITGVGPFTSPGGASGFPDDTDYPYTVTANPGFVLSEGTPSAGVVSIIDCTVEVEAVQVTSTTTTTTTTTTIAPVSASTLPFTGFALTTGVGSGLAILGAGLVLLGATAGGRRRRGRHLGPRLGEWGG